MNVASLELCKELYKLSGWGNEDDITTFYDASEFEDVDFRKLLIMHDRNCPAYDLGYLLQKLCEVKVQLRLEHNHQDMNWYCYYSGKIGTELFDEDWHWNTGANNPEDAAAKLAIELFKQGILK